MQDEVTFTINTDTLPGEAAASPPWPFESVTREQWERLTERQKGAAEFHLREAVERIEARAGISTGIRGPARIYAWPARVMESNLRTIDACSTGGAQVIALRLKAQRPAQ